MLLTWYVETQLMEHALREKLIWRSIRDAMDKNQYEAVETWSRLASHTLFIRRHQSNWAKFGRKLLICAMRRGDSCAFRDAFDMMALKDQDDVLTRFLMLKFSLATWDEDLMSESIKALMRSAGETHGGDILDAYITTVTSKYDQIYLLRVLQDLIAQQQDHPRIIIILLQSTLKLMGAIQEGCATITTFAQDICAIFATGK